MTEHRNKQTREHWTHANKSRFPNLDSDSEHRCCGEVKREIWFKGSLGGSYGGWNLYEPGFIFLRDLDWPANDLMGKQNPLHLRVFVVNRSFIADRLKHQSPEKIEVVWTRHFVFSFAFLWKSLHFLLLLLSLNCGNCKKVHAFRERMRERGVQSQAEVTLMYKEANWQKCMRHTLDMCTLCTAIALFEYVSVCGGVCEEHRSLAKSFSLFKILEQSALLWKLCGEGCCGIVSNIQRKHGGSEPEIWAKTKFLVPIFEGKLNLAPAHNLMGKKYPRHYRISFWSLVRNDLNKNGKVCQKKFLSTKDFLLLPVLSRSRWAEHKYLVPVEHLEWKKIETWKTCFHRRRKSKNFFKLRIQTVFVFKNVWYIHGGAPKKSLQASKLR